MPITQAQFDGDLAPFFQKVTAAIAAFQKAIVARDATISAQNKTIADLQAGGTPPPAPDFTTEDAQVAAASSELDTALSTVPTAPGAVPPATVTDTSGAPVVPQFVKDAQAANARLAPEQSQ